VVISGETVVRCSDCTQYSQYGDPVFYCEICCSLAHKQESKRVHSLDKVSITNEELYQLELLSVICSVDDHYGCFTRDLNTGTWLFFDSMAEKHSKP